MEQEYDVSGSSGMGGAEEEGGGRKSPSSQPGFAVQTIRLLTAGEQKVWAQKLVGFRSLGAWGVLSFAYSKQPESEGGGGVL